MSPGKPGRIPQIVQLLKDAKRPMTVKEIVKEWESNNAYEYTPRQQLVSSLSYAAKNHISTGVVRVKQGVYEYVDPNGAQKARTAGRANTVKAQTDGQISAEAAIAGVNRSTSAAAALSRYPVAAAKAAAKNQRPQISDAPRSAAFNPYAEEPTNHVRFDVAASAATAAPPSVRYVLDIVGHMRDGGLLLKDARTGKVWIAREV